MGLTQRQLAEAIATLRRDPLGPGGDPHDPDSAAYAYVTRELIERQIADTRELRGDLRRIWLGVIAAVIGSILSQVL